MVTVSQILMEWSECFVHQNNIWQTLRASYDHLLLEINFSLLQDWFFAGSSDYDFLCWVICRSRECMYCDGGSDDSCGSWHSNCLCITDFNVDARAKEMERNKQIGINSYPPGRNKYLYQNIHLLCFHHHDLFLCGIVIKQHYVITFRYNWYSYSLLHYGWIGQLKT